MTDFEGVKKNEYFLWAAVLEQAILDLNEPEYSIRHSALQWIKSRDEHFSSFVFCCLLLDLDPNKVRNKILKKNAKRLIFHNTKECSVCGKRYLKSKMRLSYLDNMYVCENCELNDDW